MGRKSVKNNTPATITHYTTKKERLYLDEAEFLYVDLMYSFKELAAKIPVAETTLRDWGDKHQWTEKKKQRIRDRVAIRTELESFCIEELRALKKDRHEGREISQSRFYTIMRLTELTFKAKIYDESIRAEGKAADPKPLTLDEEKRRELEKEFGLV
jgi:uncharacterized protein YjcR